MADEADLSRGAEDRQLGAEVAKQIVDRDEAGQRQSTCQPNLPDVHSECPGPIRRVPGELHQIDELDLIVRPLRDARALIPSSAHGLVPTCHAKRPDRSGLGVHSHYLLAQLLKVINEQRDNPDSSKVAAAALLEAFQWDT
jgi:hypothetical protein